MHKLQPEYAVSKSHYVAAPAEGAYITTKDKKTKMLIVLCLYFVYKAELLNMQNHPIMRMEKLFQVSDGSAIAEHCTMKQSTRTTLETSYVWSSTCE